MNILRTYRLCFALSAVILASIVTSCKMTHNSVDSKDLSYIYNPTKNPFTPLFTVSNPGSEISVLSLKLFASDLFFSQANPKGVSMALLQLNVNLFSVREGRRSLADTAFYLLNIVEEKGKPEYVFKIPLTVEPGAEYVAEVRILDKLRMSIVQSFVSFNTLSDNNRYNFLARGQFEQTELFKPVLRSDEFVNLVYLRGHIDSIYLSFYRSYKEIPDPPSILLPEKNLDYDPDTIVHLPYSDTLPLMLPNEGIYLFSLEENIKDGYTFTNFGPSFPNMTTPEKMAEPLIYLTTPDEVNRIITSEKPKSALDDFWIRSGGNIERARELIRIYYTRALFSNYYFTSYKEGWRSDRGMIYIIYGPPDKVYKTIDGESWGYRKPFVKSSWGGRVNLTENYMFFNFRKKENIFSDNDFYLNRNQTPVSFWDQAVLSWRRGIVFRLDNPEDI